MKIVLVLSVIILIWSICYGLMMTTGLSRYTGYTGPGARRMQR